MALTRKFLSALGIEEEKAEQIIAAHGETVDGLKAERDKYKEDADKLPSVQVELDSFKAAAEKNEKDPYKVKYEAVKEELDNFKKDVEARETAAKKAAVYRQLLKGAGVSEKHIDKVMKVSDVDSLELDEDGNAKDADKLTKAIKDEWSDFIPTETSKGADVPTPPSNSGGTTKTKKEIMEIKDTAERQEAWKEYLNNQKGN